jgi:sulfane dehydrogenase subunit SoxC
MLPRNGLLDRRAFLSAGAGILSAAVVPAAVSQEPWRSGPGQAPSEYGMPGQFAKLKRLNISGHAFAQEAGASSTPLESLNGTLTPNSLHFERHHSGVPNIDPSRHQLSIFGDVKLSLNFSYEHLLRYPLVSRVLFLECSGNSYANVMPKAADKTAGEINGLLSCAEWTGIPLSRLLQEVGVDPAADWLVATGADSAGMNRSIPLSLALEDAMIALYQNGEPLRGEQGYPMRLLVPGCEGNVSIKWLRGLQIRRGAAHTREETSKYTDLQQDGSARQFSLKMGVKSVITSPSGTMTLAEKGVYEVTGLAWSGHGKIETVEVSADAGLTWIKAQIQSDNTALRPVRFRVPWRWLGQTATLQSRAIDSSGHIQPTRDMALANSAPGFSYHFNGIQSWNVDSSGRVRNVYV